MREQILKLLNDLDCKNEVEQYASYCHKILHEKKRDGSLKNPWMKNKSSENLAQLFKRVQGTGMFLDGVHITIQSTGISYDYVAYKNKMLLVYPDSKVDMGVVNKDDVFNTSKESGKVMYRHVTADPFAKEDIVGAYCVIKNIRGEFMTILNKEELEKHRKVAKTDFIWKAWFKEMVMKTVIKKACKYHFDDVFTEIEDIDNENYDIENPISLDIKYKAEVDEIDTLDELGAYYKANKGIGKDFDAYVVKRKALITKASADVVDEEKEEPKND
jgi:hypothetical protein